MSVNMGKIDRGVRLVLAAALLYGALATAALGSGILFWLALAVAAIFVLTAVVGTCPLYSIVGINTCPVRR